MYKNFNTKYYIRHIPRISIRYKFYLISLLAYVLMFLNFYLKTSLIHEL